jgi:CheY-like chemotaxis protein
MKKILVVDDEQDVRSAVVTTLEDTQCQILEADSGSSAYDLAVAERPDLIVSDVMMDNGNGFALVNLLKRDERTAAIKVIMMTGAAHHAGAWESEPHVSYLQKPFTAEEILAEVDATLSEAV